MKTVKNILNNLLHIVSLKAFLFLTPLLCFLQPIQAEERINTKSQTLSLSHQDSPAQKNCIYGFEITNGTTGVGNHSGGFILFNKRPVLLCSNEPVRKAKLKSGPDRQLLVEEITPPEHKTELHTETAGSKEDPATHNTFSFDTEEIFYRFLEDHDISFPIDE